MPQADHRDGAGAAPDENATVGRLLVGVPHQSNGRRDQQQRNDPVETAHRPGDHRDHDRREWSRGMPPHRRRHHHGQREEEQRETVSAVRGVEVAGATTDTAHSVR